MQSAHTSARGLGWGPSVTFSCVTVNSSQTSSLSGSGAVGEDGGQQDLPHQVVLSTEGGDCCKHTSQGLSLRRWMGKKYFTAWPGSSRVWDFVDGNLRWPCAV